MVERVKCMLAFVILCSYWSKTVRYWALIGQLLPGWTDQSECLASLVWWCRAMRDPSWCCLWQQNLTGRRSSPPSAPGYLWPWWSEKSISLVLTNGNESILLLLANRKRVSLPWWSDPCSQQCRTRDNSHTRANSSMALLLLCHLALWGPPDTPPTLHSTQLHLRSK